MLGSLVKFLLRAVSSIAKSAFNMSKSANMDSVRMRKLTINTKRDGIVCDFCASMEGRSIIMPLLGSRNFMFEYGNLEKQSGWGGQNLLPPFHPNCRCDVEVQEA